MMEIITAVIETALCAFVSFLLSVRNIKASNDKNHAFTLCVFCGHARCTKAYAVQKDEVRVYNCTRVQRLVQ